MATPKGDNARDREQQLYIAVYAAVFAAWRGKGVDVQIADYAAKRDAASAVARMGER